LVWMHQAGSNRIQRVGFHCCLAPKFSQGL
jgi:hypothetical protein